MSFFFDSKDYKLLTIVNQILDRRRKAAGRDEVFFHPALDPHGLKEMALSNEIRVAYAVINLLDSLDTGQVQDRIEALESLRNEVLAAPTSSFRHNTGRVLIQIMKALVRAYGDIRTQLRLAHDFRQAATGNPLSVRRMLKQYHLLEMPESWNQLAFDHHVHDANTKGRKSPSHLIMDAWVKGLRKLDVIYYNYVESAAVTELVKAADIMEIKIRIGVEFTTTLHGKQIQIVWQPRGFKDGGDMQNFFQEEDCRKFMNRSREASIYHHLLIIKVLDYYNSTLRFEMGQIWKLKLKEITEQEILTFVGIGQTSRLHLAELIYRRLTAAFEPELAELKNRYTESDPEEKAVIETRINYINSISPESIILEWLPNDALLTLVADDQTPKPEIMQLSLKNLINILISLRSPSNIALNLCDLTEKDILEILFECEGRISHLEIFNLKNYEDGKLQHLKSISDLQFAINADNGVRLKRLVHNMIFSSDTENGAIAHNSEQSKRIMVILRHLPKLQNYYRHRPLKSRMGSDSTSRSPVYHGMGLANAVTLPSRARRELKKDNPYHHWLPFSQGLRCQVTYSPREHPPLGRFLTGLLRKIPGLEQIGHHKNIAWIQDVKHSNYHENAKTITTLGGFQREKPFSLETAPQGNRSNSRKWRYLNTTFKNVLKVMLGFALAMGTFVMTQSWWFLAYFGPIIWFGITGLRNIIQALLGGGGLRRTPLLRWNAYISWSRLCDSLMYTGLSVPLLELVIRILFLEKCLDINSANSPILLYTIIGLINGLYISSHNFLRGLPREAIIGNLFRSALSIPVSLLYNFILLHIFTVCNWPLSILISSSAIVSKLASDTVAGLIEGLADKAEFSRRRHFDYQTKITQLFDNFSNLELCLPEKNVLKIMSQNETETEHNDQKAKELEKNIIIHCLDLMYFWYFQPRARSVLTWHINAMSADEKEIFVSCQLLLTRVRQISQLLVDGLLGSDFARSLAFYLSKYKEYTLDMTRVIGHYQQDIPVDSHKSIPLNPKP